MVFDWFKRKITTQPAESADRDSAAESEGSAGQLPVEPEQQEMEVTDAPPSTVDPAVPAAEVLLPVTAVAPGSASEGTSGPGEPTEEDPLAWAKAAYAHLKAQQEQEQPPAAVDEDKAADDTSSTEDSSASQPPPSAPEADSPTAATAAPEVATAPVPAANPQGMGLLARAAAERQQRQADLETVAKPVVKADVPTSPERPRGADVAGDMPQLGTFDADFTWSAEVLAAQGRGIQDISIEEIDWLGRLRRGMEKTRRGFVTQLLENLGDDPLTPEVLDDLEALLLQADVGVEATDTALEALRQRMNEDVLDPAEGLDLLKTQLREQLEQPIRSSGRSLLVPERQRLNIWLLVGVNGVGKTTTLGKLANLAVRSGYSCLVAAADTFRAGAVQQVSIWAQRSQVDVITNPSTNADPAAVVFDAIGAAQARKSELLLVDTAGRLQTRSNLMEELAKIRRVIDRLGPDAVVESLLVLDASQGQNGLRQALAFAPAAQLTGAVITKLDGSSKGGVALAVSTEANLPIRFIGAGEGLRDLRPFNSFEFIEALLATAR